MPAKKIATYNPGKQNSPNLLASELKDPGSQDDLLVPLKNTNTGRIPGSYSLRYTVYALRTTDHD